MQRIRLLTIGTLKTSWIREGCGEYRKRMSPLAFFDIEELPASRENRPERQSREESDRMLKAFGGEDVRVVLDERGREMDTIAFSKFLGEKRDHGLSITFAIGGAYGFDDRVRGEADLVLSLSKMTLPHELCRLIFLEALYRGLDVLRGGKYHHG
jgi:23S rRNA (pseudouridine1915-N3)-methyltransferase